MPGQIWPSRLGCEQTPAQTLKHRRRATETVQNRQLVLFCNARTDLACMDVGFHCGSVQRADTLHLFDDFLLLALKNPVRQAGFFFCVVRLHALTVGVDAKLQHELRSWGG